MIRNTLVWLCSTTAIAAVLALPAYAQKKTTLVVGLDISDGRNYDPARSADLTPPLTMGAVTDTLLTLSTDDLVNVKPSLATAWTLVNNGAAWRFTLRPGVKFWNGDPLTAEDVKFSLDRLVNVKDQPATYASNMGAVTIVDPMTVEIAMKNPKEPLLLDLTAPSFGIYSAKMAKAQGAVSEPGADQPATGDLLTDPLLEDWANLVQERWLIGLLRLRAVDSPLAEDLLEALTATAKAPAVGRVPVWPTDPADLDRLLSLLLVGDRPGPRELELIRLWNRERPTAAAWVIDDAGPTDLSTGAAVSSVGFLNLSPSRTLAWVQRDGRAAEADLKPIDPWSFARIDARPDPL
ncbi:MAG: hypothetical protein EBZ59_13370, partial [Planctomycetia bacterium]|nr:hypothetical protein [Planctomycetia bacterium]